MTGSDPNPDVDRRKAFIVLAPPIGGWDAPAITPIHSEQFRSVCKTRRRSYGRLRMREPTLEGEVQHEATRVHHAARRRGGVAARGAGAAARQAADHWVLRLGHPGNYGPLGCSLRAAAG